LAAAEQAREEPAPALTLGELPFELLDAGLGGGERLLLDHDGLRHVVGRGRLVGDVAPDQGLGLAVARAGPALRLADFGKEVVDDAALVLVHRASSLNNASCQVARYAARSSGARQMDGRSGRAREKRASGSGPRAPYGWTSAIPMSNRAARAAATDSNWLR
jgi:hypothetical protein